MVMLSDACPAPRKTPRFPSRERHYAVRRKARDAVTSPKQLTPQCEEEGAERRLEAEEERRRQEQQVEEGGGGSCSSSDGGAGDCGCGDCRYWQLWCCDECSRRCDQVAASARDRHKKTCSSCKCPRDAHDVYHEEWVNVRERLGFKPDRLEPRDRSVSDGFCWVPPGLHSTQQIEKYFSELPPEKVPEMGSVGEKYRDKQLVQQLPKQDLALAYCKHVETQHHASYEDFISARNEIALDIGYVREAGAYTECPQCLKTLAPQDLGVVAPKFGDRTLWHPACFTCTTCKELLVDLTYCAHDDLLYCERHYAEQLKPRCAACDEVSGINYDTCEYFVIYSLLFCATDKTI